VRPPRLVAAVTVGLVLSVVTACGAPGSTRTSEIDPTDVPYRLLEQPADPARAATGSDVPGELVSTPVYLLARDGVLLEPVAAQVAPGTPEELAREALARLQDGPTELERSEGLGSALGASVGLTLVGVRDGTARVEVELTAGELAADQLPLALGQVVLTLTAVGGIDRVQLVSDGEAVEMALPGGKLTTDPVGAADYESLTLPEDG
jgi:spore germination protein GerM